VKKIIFISLILCPKKMLSQNLIYNNGIYVEKPIFADTSRHRYSLDNKIFTINGCFTYDYYYLDSSSVKLKFYKEGSRIHYDNPMGIPDHTPTPPEVIDKIKLIVTDNLKIFLVHDSSYSQTVISYQYLNHFGELIASEQTGVIDNAKDIWLHPPRENNFKILEINPFPIVLLEDTTIYWSWSVEVWQSWSDPRWKVWNGIIIIKNEYKRLKNEIIETEFGKLDCLVSEGIGTSKIGNTYLKSYFNTKYGFVRLEYTNINSTKLIMWLVNISEHSL
jgi:hypothetical protein